MASAPRSALIFKVNKLGDNIVFLPVAQRLAAEGIFDEVTIWNTSLAIPLYQPLAPRVRLEIISREDFYPAWKNPLALSRLTLRARSAHPQFALVAEDMGNTAYFLALASGARARIGARLPYIKIPWAINREVSLEPDAPAAEKAWQLGAALAAEAGGSPWPERPPAPDLAHLCAARTESYDVLIHAGASLEYKRWFMPRYLELAARLSRDLRVGWIAASDVPELAAPPAEIVRPADLAALISALASCRLFIGNNSGPMNIASALGTPSLIFVGPSARSWDPYWRPERSRVLRHEQLPCIACDPPGLPLREVCTNAAHPMACMDRWSVDEVESEARAWLAKWAAAPAPEERAP